MISMVGDDHTVGAGFSPGESQGQFIGLRAGAGKHGIIKIVRKLICELPGIFQYEIVQIAGVGIQLLHLLVDRVHDLRVTVAHVRHVVIHVEILTAADVIQPDTFPSDQMNRVVVKQSVGGPQ